MPRTTAATWFAWAGRAGGFTSRARYEPGARALGHVQPTIDHFEADAGRRGL